MNAIQPVVWNEFDTPFLRHDVFKKQWEKNILEIYIVLMIPAYI